MKTFGKILWLLLLFMVSQIYGIIMGFTMVPSQLAGQPYTPNLFLQIFITATAMASIYLAYLIAKTVRMPIPNWKGWSKKDSLFVLGMTIFTRLYAHLGIYLLQLMKIESTANDAAINEMFANFSFPLVFLIIAISGPILEEWIFRAGIIGFLFEKYPLIGITVSSLVFGALHMPTNLISWAIYGGLGLVFSLIYYKTKRLELAMAVHMLHNALSFWL